MASKIKTGLFVLYVSITSLVFFLRTLKKLRGIRKKRIVFVNYRAFGHSILDSFAVYDYYREDCLIISIGEEFERNSCLLWIIPSESLYHLILPSWHRKINAQSKYSLRKYVGPQVSKLLKVAQKLRILNYTTRIEDQNTKIMLDLAPIHLQKYLGWDPQKCSGYIRSRVEAHQANEITLSNGVGTQIYASIVDQIQNENLLIPEDLNRKFLNGLISKCNVTSACELRIYTLIISSRGKPHHGSGISRYIPIITHLLNSPNCVVILLGDYLDDITNLRKSNIISPRLLIPEDFDIAKKEVQFLSIFNSSLVFGDPSGAWSIFLLIGSRGLLIDQIPTGELYSRCIHVPRVWESKSLQVATLDFLLNDSFFRLREFISNNELWRPRLHNSAELSTLFHSIPFAHNLDSFVQIKNYIKDELALDLLRNNSCSYIFL